MAALFSLSVLIQVVWYGWTGSVLWLWFVVPLGLPPVNYAQFAGMWLVLQVFKGPAKSSGLTAEQLRAEAKKELPMLLFWPALLLFIGVLVKALMTY